MKNLSNIIILLTLTCVTIIPVSSQEADKDGNFAIGGKGNKSCHNYNISRNTDEEQRFKDYIMGFLTAFNVQMPETYRVSGNMNLDEILAWLDDYCQLKPVISFEQSLSDFIIENRDERMKRSLSKYRR